MKKEITIPEKHHVSEVAGPEDKFIKLISKNFSLKIFVKGNRLILEGEEKELDQIVKLFHSIMDAIKNGYNISSYDVTYGINQIKRGQVVNYNEIFKNAIKVSLKGKIIVPRTYGQACYIEDIKNYDIVFSIGPAGTGKTYLAMALAINYLIDERVKKIILTRPVVEAGESLGYLPGNIEEKVNPYLRPLYDAIFDMMSYEKFVRLSHTGVIEIAPLAYMRGRTLNDAFIILDEGQNTNPEQMKMFLTRVGVNSKVVITGDITQIDLPVEKKSGLILIQSILKDIDGVKFSYLTSEDVVRHYLVQRIIDAYERHDPENKRNSQ
ncbi:MAG: PhoH family protein [Spirochaetes bacterium]|nr:PhoH family protein [Spirochaetota bacterium]